MTVARAVLKLAGTALRRVSWTRPESYSLRRAFHIFRDVPPLRSYRRNLLHKNSSVGLVPTMGALHEGHLTLVRQAATENSEVFISIYVNPTQFGLNEDLGSYPKTWANDISMLEELDEELKQDGKGRVTAIFAPITGTMYPTLPPDSSLPGEGSFITVTPLASVLEGASRPVFFRGVATVCMKLFNIVQPERVYFGQKDIQQTVIIKRMVKDFHLNIDVRIGPTQREADGLAFSSRNVYLGERRRTVGVVLSQALRAAEEAFANGQRNRDEVLAPVWNVLNVRYFKEDQSAPEKRARFDVDYISLADPDTLDEVEHIDEQKGAILSGAIKMLPLDATQEGEKLGLGGDSAPVRLIDNLILQSRT